ncbi:MAG: S-layer homology domain-containing protein, partial [Firmicutes bacterium]|nr:S-layer homology domain-containing protein [Bacillota bacterium]
YHAVYNDRAKGSNGVDNTHLNHWGGDQIAYMTAQELDKAGVLKLKNAPDSTPLTRGEFTMGLVRALQLKAELSEYSNFADVKMDAEYAMSVAEAKALGIVVGDENAVFNGERPVTYQEVALMLERGLRASGAEMPAVQGTDMESRVASAASNLGSIGIDIDTSKNITASDCYKAFIDAYNEVTEIQNLQAEKEQSIDEIEKTENVVLN